MADPAQMEDVLVQSGVISVQQAELVKLEAANTGKAAERIIEDRGFAKSEDIVKARAQLFGIPFADLSAKAVTPDILGLIPEPVASRYLVLPFELDAVSGTLSVAMADPLDVNITAFLEKKTGKKIRPFFAAPGLLKTAIDERYSRGLTTEVTAALAETGPRPEEVPTESAKEISAEVIADAPVTKITSSLLEFAVKSRATDIHIEPLEEKTRIRYRIDGILYEKLLLPNQIHDALVSRVKILSNLKIDEKRIPQDGRFNFKSDEAEVDVRVSPLPTVFGEKVVLLLLKKSGGIPTLGDLGLRGLALRNLETSILRPHGIIIVCGPTGSGKTTTLYAILSKINSTKVNIVTIEDPVEYQIPGVNQVQINTAAGVTFAAGLRAFLRQDPNIILVGEIRDKETTDLAVQAALTGHLVFSTLHTSNASGALPRLLDLGAEPFLLASSLNAVAGQRILRRICPTCKEGRILERKSKKGKLFYSCSRYPDCKQAFWDRPTGEPCPKCGFPTLLKKSKALYCPQEECKYKVTIELE